MLKLMLKKLFSLTCIVGVAWLSFLTMPTYALTLEEILKEMGGVKIEFKGKLNSGSKDNAITDPVLMGVQLINRVIEAEWVQLEFNVINDSPEAQFISNLDGQQSLLQNDNSDSAKSNQNAPGIWFQDPRGVELAPSKTQQDGKKVLSSHSLGGVEYYYHFYGYNYTIVKFRVTAYTPVKSERECVLIFNVLTKGAQLNSYLNVTSEIWNNSKYENTCVAYIQEDPEALRQNCNFLWCERPKDKNFITVNIVILPPKTLQLTKLKPPCKQTQESLFPSSVFIYPKSTNPKDKARTEERYDLQARKLVCPGGKWIVNLPADYQFTKFEYRFVKPAFGHQDIISHYDITPSSEIVSFPTPSEIKNTHSCTYDASTKSCTAVLPASGTGGRGPAPVIRTPEGRSSSVTLTNKSTFASFAPIFSAVSVTPYRKNNPQPTVRGSYFHGQIKR